MIIPLLSKAFEIVHIFERGSGSKLHLDKTEGMRFGSMAGREDGLVNTKWQTDKIKVLEIFPPRPKMILNHIFFISQL